MASLSIRNVHKTFANGIKVLKGINLDIEDGQFVILLGGSGCGKSTLLNAIAGLETVTRGDILIDGRLVNDLPPKDRDIAMVFQSYALYPSMTVRENILFGLKVRKVPKPKQKEILKHVSEMLNIASLLERKPSELSGGQCQRVAMGRALARDPAIFLFDEPLSNLDAKLRIKMRSEIKLMHQRLGTTTVYVTHDQIEAMTLGDRVAVMKDGLIQQFGTPQEIYDNPINLFVAGFVGTPPMNFIPATLGETSLGYSIIVESSVQKTALHLPFISTHLRAYLGKEIIVGLRPERITDPHSARNVEQAKAQSIEVKVEMIEPTGPDTLVSFQLNGTPVIARVHPASQPQAQKPLTLLVETAQVVLFAPKTGERIA